MNLNIEGTKHEKAVLVILSYVVGFTAGFIVFGLASAPSLQSVAVVPEVITPLESSESVANVSTNNMVEDTEAPDMSQPVLYKDGRLMANSNGASVLLSAQIQTVDAETAKAFANQGVHERIPQYLASDDGNFIYYCEQHAGEDNCINFIYSVKDQIIQYVTVDGAKHSSAPSAAKTAMWDGPSLVLGSARSVSPETPWKLITTQ